MLDLFDGVTFEFPICGIGLTNDILRKIDKTVGSLSDPEGGYTVTTNIYKSGADYEVRSSIQPFNEDWTVDIFKDVATKIHEVMQCDNVAVSPQQASLAFFGGQPIDRFTVKF